jgi:hypothetical protein
MSVICKNEIDGKFRYTKEGYRVIALATKELKEGFNYRKAQTIERQFAET